MFLKDVLCLVMVAILLSACGTTSQHPLRSFSDVYPLELDLNDKLDALLGQIHVGLSLQEFSNIVTEIKKSLPAIVGKRHTSVRHVLTDPIEEDGVLKVVWFRFLGSASYYAIFENGSLKRILANNSHLHRAVHNVTQQLDQDPTSAIESLKNSLTTSQSILISTFVSNAKRGIELNISNLRVREEYLEPTPFLFLFGGTSTSRTHFFTAKGLLLRFDATELQLDTPEPDVHDRFGQPLTTTKIDDTTIRTYGARAHTGWHPNPRVVVFFEDAIVVRIFTYYVTEHGGS